jgi:hypothetical protein
VIGTNLSDSMGLCLPNSPIFCAPEHRWYVCEGEDYPSATVFCPYAIGAGYNLSQELVKSDCFAKHLASIPLFPLEDVLAGELLHIGVALSAQTLLLIDSNLS